MLFPLMLWSGISLAVYTGLLVPMISATIPEATQAHKFMLAMSAMTALGFGEIIGGLFIGWIIDTKGSQMAVVVNVILVTFSTTSVLSFLYINEYNWLVFLMTFAWGL